MLVLSRKRSEAIHIGQDVTVTVVAIQGGQVRLGVEAPRAIPVHRCEARKARCPLCGRVVRVSDPGNGCSPWLSSHKAHGKPCIGSQLAAGKGVRS